MTCIVGIEYDGKVYLGGDSAAVAGWDTQIQEAPKVFKLGDFVMGYTSSFRMGQLLQYDFTPPQNECEDDMTYMVKHFVPALRDLMKTGGFMTVKDNREEAGAFLVGYRGKLYSIQNDFSVMRYVDRFDGTDYCYNAVGVGAPYALAVMWRDIRRELADYGKLPPARYLLQSALLGAEFFSNGVTGPFHFVASEE